MEKRVKIEMASAVPYRVTEKGIEVLLVTSRGKGDWIFPKGRVERGDTHQETALREAFEEAGAKGTLYSDPIATYSHPRPYGVDRVRVFLMSVHKMLEDWPEKGERKRQWVSFDAIERFLTKEFLVSLVPKIRSHLKDEEAAA